MEITSYMVACSTVEMYEIFMDPESLRVKFYPDGRRTRFLRNGTRTYS
jgi:hypothetical protein